MAAWTPPALPAQWTWTADLPPWVGRRPELEQLDRCWGAVQHGVRQLVLVAGEPGAGKSRLVAEVASRLHARGVPVLVGRCTAELGLPFDPLVTPIRELSAAVDRGELSLQESHSLPPAQSRRLLDLITSAAEPAAVSQVNFEMPALDAVLAALGAACADGPLVVVLEDLHWAGESALRALRHCVERTADMPLLVLATHRDTPPDVSDAVLEVGLAMLRLPGVRRLHLDGLDTADVTSYLAGVGAGAPSEVGPAAAVLRDRTGGNPFLLGEVWRELRERGGLAALATSRVDVPWSLQALVRQRLGHLEPMSRDLVSLGAVIGESFDVPLLRQVLGRPVSAEETYAALAAAVAEGLVEIVPDQPGHFRFAHALAREAVLQEVPAFRRACAHAAVGQALEKEGGSDGPAHLVRLAHHFSQAAGLGLEDRAVRYLRQAASVATTRLAHSDAAALLERAADLAHDQAGRAELSLAAARAHVRAGHLQRARALDEVVATTGPPEARLDAAVGYETASWPTGVGALRSAQLLEDALARSELDVRDPRRVAATAALGRALMFAGRGAEAIELLDRTLAVARDSDDGDLLLTVLTTALTGVVDLRVDQWVEWLLRQRDRAEEAAALAVAAGDLRRLGTASQVRVYTSYVLGRREPFDEALAELQRVGRLTQEPFWVWRSLLLEGSRHLMRGDLASAAAAQRSSRRMAVEFGHSLDQVDGPLSLPAFVLRRETGGLDFARPLLERDDLPRHQWSPGLVALHCELGLLGPARAVLRRALDDNFGDLRASVTWPASLALLAEATVHLDEPAVAEGLLEELAPLTRLNLSAAEFLAPFGSAERHAAALAGVLGRGDVEDHFAAALQADTEMGSPLHVATTRAEWARWLRRVGAPESRSEEQAAAARELADRHGLQRVHRLLGGRARRSWSRPATSPWALTTREIEVLRLVGRGRSNRQIARELVISEHTAANHVRSILAKTGTANRTEAAHVAARRGLLGDTAVGGGPSDLRGPR